MSGRARVVPVVLGIAAIVAAGGPRAGAQDRGRVAELQREVDSLRAELNALQDLGIEQARRSDAERKRLLERIEALQAQAAPGTPRITARLRDTPLAQAAATLGESGKVAVVLEAPPPAGITITLNLRGVPLPMALDLACDNAYDAEGRPAPLRWQRRGEQVVIEDAR